MTQTTLTTTAPAKLPAARGFGDLPCPKCGQDARIRVDLDNLTGPESMTCPDCDAEFGVGDVRDFISRWSRVLAWIDAAPQLPE